VHKSHFAAVNKVSMHYEITDSRKSTS